MNPSDRDYLLNFYREDIRKLASLVGRNLSTTGCEWTSFWSNRPDCESEPESGTLESERGLSRLGVYLSIPHGWTRD